MSTEHLAVPEELREVPTADGHDNGTALKDVAQRFRELASRWKKETAHHSSMAMKADHPAYREILALGSAVVPLMLADLKHSGASWFHALRILTGTNPVTEESRGIQQEMVDAWIRWGRESGFAA